MLLAAEPPADMLALLRVLHTGVRLGVAAVFYRVTGADRAMLYRLALATGFRAAELATLTHEHFDPYAPRPRW